MDDFADRYESPLSRRYASKAMRAVFSERRKFTTWRRLWVALAETQHELGLASVTSEQVEEMRARIEDLNLDVARAREKEVRHDVMSHVFAFGVQCPKAAPIIHLGATSCFVTDNTELCQMRDGLFLIKRKLVALLARFAEFILDYADLPTLGFTHYQPAQPTTVGKRAAMWAQDFLLDFEALCAQEAVLLRAFRGAKGTTGTQASYLELFAEHDDPHGLVRELDRRITAKMGFDAALPVTGQTYTRKIDHQVLGVLSGIAASAHKFGTDLRLLASHKEIEEPFEASQIGSSAMPYKRNPMRAERLCSLSRHLASIAQGAWQTHAVQWMERTLDDSASRRFYLAESFLLADAIMELLLNVVAGLVVYPARIARNLAQELPFLATEKLLMEGVKQGGDRQALHEAIRRHSLAASQRIKGEGGENDLFARLKADPAFASLIGRFETLTEARHFIGRAPEQARAFVEEHLRAVLDRYPDWQDASGEVTV